MENEDALAPEKMEEFIKIYKKRWIMKDKKIDTETVLFEFSAHGYQVKYTMAHSFTGIFITGATGSGKTSGSYKKIATSFLRNGYGGTFLTSKPDDLDMIISFCKETGRMDDLIVVSPEGKNYFNFLEYISKESKSGVSYSANIHQVLMTVFQSAESRSGGGDKDQFWINAIDQLILNTIDLCLIGCGRVTIEDLYNIVRTAPKKSELKNGTSTTTQNVSAYGVAAEKAKLKVKSLIDEYYSKYPENHFDGYSLENYDAMLADTIPEYRVLKMVTEFFNESFFEIPEKTRSLVLFSFTNFLASFLREPIYSLLCRYPSTFTPESCYDGKIIVINLPVKTYQKAGQDTQILWKYLYQCAVEKRNIEENGRPIFLMADESHLFTHSNDSECQATARSARLATCYVTQNLPQWYAAYGGEHAIHKVTSFLGNLGTKFFHCNTCHETNTFASNLIGDAYFEDHSRSVQMSSAFMMSNSTGIKLEQIVRPVDFVGLLTGGAENGYKVHAYIHMQGRKLPNGFHHQKISFNQLSNQ